MINKLKKNKALGLLLGAFVLCLFATFAMAGKGTKTITTVIDNGDTSYSVVLDTTTGITVGDHFGALVADGTGGLYTVSSIGTAVVILDDLTEENGGVFGAPVAGSSWYSTPSTNLTYSKPPDAGVGWGPPMRRNSHLVETVLGPTTGLYGISQITTAATGDIFVYGGTNYDKWTLITPGTSGQVLTANGTTSLPSWQAAAGGTNALLDASAHTDTVAQAVTRGSIIYGNSTPAWDELTIGAANTVLGSDGTDASWRTLSTTLDGAVSSTQGTLVYRGSSTWDGIAAGNSGTVLTTSGASANPAWHTLSNLMGSEFGTTQGTILYHNGTDWVTLATSTSGDVLTTQGAGANPIWSTPGGGSTHEMLSATHTDSTASTVSRGSLIVGDSAPKWVELTVGAANTVVASDGTDTTFTTVTSLLDQFSSTHGAFLFRGASGWEAIAPSTSGLYLRTNGSGNDPVWSAPAGGGTNALLDGSSHTDTTAQTVSRGSIIVGNSTPAWDEVTVGSANTVVGSDGTDTTFRTMTATLDGAFGSTQGQILYRNASAWVVLAPGTSGQVLQSGGAGANVSWTAASGTTNNGVNHFRLSLVTAEPVPTTDQTAKTTIYLTPYKGNLIHTYDSSVWTAHTSAEVSLALGTLTDATNYDVFAYYTGSAIALEALAWTNDTTRATALARQDGILCKTGALDRRYVGTFRTTSTTTTEDSAQKRFLWNYNNRIQEDYWINETTDSWTESGNGTWSALNGGGSVWKHEFVIGVDEDTVSAKASVQCLISSSQTLGYCQAIELDWTSGAPTRSQGGWGSVYETTGTGDAGRMESHSSWKGRPGVGYHFLQAVETTANATSVTVYGDAAANVVNTNSGMSVRLWR